MDLKTDFYRQISVINAQIDALTSTASSAERAAAIDSCITAISALTITVQDAASSSLLVPAHDQRTYTQAIRDLQERLAKKRESVAPRAKFAFKSKKKTDANEHVEDNTRRTAGAMMTDVTMTMRPPVTTTATEQQWAIMNDGMNAPPSKTTPRATTERALSVIRLPSTPLLDPIVSHCRSCIVLATPDPPTNSSCYPTLTLRDIASSLVLLPYISGPLHVTSLQRTTLVVPSCGQFRMHDCQDCDVYLFCTSRPIVEGVSGIRFAPFVSAISGTRMEGDELAMAEKVELPDNMWCEVDDFHWLHGDDMDHGEGRVTSPNWTVLPAKERVIGGSDWDEILKETNVVVNQEHQEKQEPSHVRDGDADEKKDKAEGRMMKVEHLLKRAGVRLL